MTEGMSPIERLLAHEEIRQLAARYAVAVDSRDLDTLVGLFVDDVRVGPDRRGRDALRVDFARQVRGIGMSILNVGTHVIDLEEDDPENASGTVYCKAKIEVDDQLVHQAIVFFDAYTRRNGTWYFVNRMHELFYGAPVGTDPLAPANWPRRPIGTGTRPHAWETWEQFWADET